LKTAADETTCLSEQVVSVLAETTPTVCIRYSRFANVE